MARYDWERGYGRTSGYDSGHSSWSDAWQRGPGGGFWGQGRGGYRSYGVGDEGRGFRPGRGYDRGIYGGNYPTYGGYPGGNQQGMYYGGGNRYGEQIYGRRGGYTDLGPSGYDRGMNFRYGGGGYGEDFGGGYGGSRGGYDVGNTRDTFVPEEAYLRHPEMDRPQEHIQERWPGQGNDWGDDVEMDDDEIQQAVRRSLHQDNWVPADRIQVDVNGGVVTLTGEVEDYMQARYAWDDAWETSGVRGVINNLTVRTDRPQEPHGDVMPQTSGGKRKK